MKLHLVYKMALVLLGRMNLKSLSYKMTPD